MVKRLYAGPTKASTLTSILIPSLGYRPFQLRPRNVHLLLRGACVGAKPFRRSSARSERFMVMFHRRITDFGNDSEPGAGIKPLGLPDRDALRRSVGDNRLAQRTLGAQFRRRCAGNQLALGCALEWKRRLHDR